MSYILEALRKAQAERERGQVPGIDAQLAPAPPASRLGRRGPVLWLGLGLAAGLLSLGAILFWRTDEGPGPSGTRVEPAPSKLPEPAHLPLAPAPAPLPPAAVAALPQVVSAATPVPASGPARVPVVEGAANPRAAEAAPTLRLDRLSPEQRRELGPLVIGGSIWSENASSRFVIVNGQVVREGEAAAPGVTLERIEPKAAVLRWRELRIELPF